MHSESSDRLTRMESHLAHLEHLLEQLNQVVIEQGRELTRLKSWQQRMARSIEAAERSRIEGTDSKPPHYR